MVTDQPNPIELLESVGGSYLSIHAMLGEAENAQWQAGLTPVAKDEVTTRSHNTVSDPTWFHYADGRRQDLREAVIEANKALRLAEQAMAFAVYRLQNQLQDDPESSGPSKG